MVSMEKTEITHPLVSITVAVYNVEKWIEACLESIKNQTYSNWECIIVNDGSTDNSPDIAQRFCIDDSRFRMVNKPNGGLSTARNSGLELARGEWIFFADGDDTLTADCIHYCVNTIKQYDVLACSCVSIDERGVIISRANQGSKRYLSQVGSLKELLDRSILTSVWSKFYRRSIIGNITFNESLKSAEDLHFNTTLFLSRPDITVKVTNHPIYQYRIISSSLSHVRNEARKERLYDQIREMDNLYAHNEELIRKSCLNEYACNMMRDILYDFQLQGWVKRFNLALAGCLYKWNALIQDKSSTEWLESKYLIDSKLSMGGVG